MKISNFQLIESKESDIGIKSIIASIDIENRFLFWKTNKTAIIHYKPPHWVFEKSGNLTPGYIVEALVRKWEMKHNKKL
jgi:hypothetical protein